MLHRTRLLQIAIYEEFLKTEKASSANIAPGMAIPHIILPGEKEFEIILVRAQVGVNGKRIDRR